MMRHPSHRQCRDFGILLIVVFLIVFAVRVVQGDTWHDRALVWLEIALLLVPVVFGEPTLLSAPCRLFLTVGQALNKVVIPALLVPFYFVVITPFGVVGRLFGWDPMRRKGDGEAASYWAEPREDERGLERYEQPF